MVAVKCMKRIGIVVAAVVFAYLCLLIFDGVRADADKRRRGELQSLDLVGAGVSQYLNQGGNIPTNWLALSNAVIGSLGIGPYQFNPVPFTAERYIVLARPVAFSNVFYPGSIFLVRSKPQGWGSHSGRWVLIGSSNRVSRTWIGDKYLIPEIRSQIGI